MKIFIDLDGVMFDFESHFNNLYKVRHSDVSDDEMWDTVNLVNPHDFFESMPAFEHAKKLVEVAVDYVGMPNVAFLTACPKSNYVSAAKQKKAAVENLLGSNKFHVLPMMHGRYKYLFMHRIGDVLIDDFEKNLVPWRKHGGIGIHHRGVDDTLEELEKIVEYRFGR